MTTPGEFYAALEGCLSAGETVAVATIVRTRGSSPREAGAKMLVHADGATDGTVGGGCGEAEVWQAAIEVIADRTPRNVVVDLTEEIAMTTDGVCGGVIDIYVEAWEPTADALPGPQSGRSPHHLAGELLAALEQRQTALAVTVIQRSSGVPCAPGEKLLVVDGEVRAGSLDWKPLQARVLADLPEVVAGGRSVVRTYAIDPSDGAPAAGSRNGHLATSQTAGQVAVFVELVQPRPVLVIVGAGHIAVPLALIGKVLDFDVVVVDDRPAFANAGRFPTADRIVVDDFEAALDAIPMTPSTYVVLVTRGHVHDVRSLRKIIRTRPAYIGMIGSRRRVFAVFKLLQDEGVPADDLLTVHAPIGLDIKTETPGEIAVSIGAELVKVRRGGGAPSISDLLRDQYRYTLGRIPQAIG